MSLASTLAVSLQGISGNVVTVEVDIADGIPSYTLLGLPDTALSESRDRIRAALVNCGEVWPHRKVTVSLSPAWLPKSGSSFDLAICIAIVSASVALPEERQGNLIFLGELALDGALRSVRGVLPSLIAAYESGFTTAIVPSANAQEAALMTQMNIIAMPHLRDVLHWIRTGERSEALEIDLQWQESSPLLDFCDVASRFKPKLQFLATGTQNPKPASARFVFDFRSPKSSL